MNTDQDPEIATLDINIYNFFFLLNIICAWNLDWVKYYYTVLNELMKGKVRPERTLARVKF